jgi:hypothetical protein
MSDSRPIDMPPGISTRAPADARSRPIDLPDDSLGESSFGEAGQATVPTDSPPAMEAQAAVSASAWRTGKRFRALWAKAEDRNAWVAVSDGGWKQLSDASESGSVVLSAVAAHAFQTRAIVKFREEDDGKIHEIYVWR